MSITKHKIFTYKIERNGKRSQTFKKIQETLRSIEPHLIKIKYLYLYIFIKKPALLLDKEDSSNGTWGGGKKEGFQISTNIIWAIQCQE